AYEFLGWTVEDGPDEALRPGTLLGELANDVVLWARWQPVAYIIDYHGPSGDNPPSYTVEDNGVILAPPPAQPGYEFTGWYTAPEGGDRIEAIPPGVTGTFAVWARYMKIDVPVSPSPDPSTTPPSDPPSSPPSAPPSQSPPPSVMPPVSSSPLASAVVVAPVVSSPAPSVSPSTQASTVSSSSAPPSPSISPSARPRATTAAPEPSASPVAPSAPVVTEPEETEEPTPSPSPTSASPSASPSAVTPSPVDKETESPVPQTAEAPPPPPAGGFGRQAAGWSLIAAGSAGLVGLGAYWFRRVLYVV
ncbi:MAG: InlB B-repeat-containing protein, partial [Bifidobacteriaceae bacterium]|nr:InlB B-repeat-containing protein [Bifidobacteriaceae bacterium]